MEAVANFMAALAGAVLGMDWLEFTGLASGLLCVWLLIRQNIWTFPIGLVYAVISVVVFLEAKLYADVLLSGYYLVMNAYGWYFWAYGGVRTRDDELPVRHTPWRAVLWLSALTALAIAVMGYLFDTRTDAELAYWDSATTCMSFAGMWLTARKYLESWLVWLLVDLIATAIYLLKGIELYAVLYGIYLIMAVQGWRAWQSSRRLELSSA